MIMIREHVACNDEKKSKNGDWATLFVSLGLKTLNLNFNLLCVLIFSPNAGCQVCFGFVCVCVCNFIGLPAGLDNHQAIE